MFNMSTTGRDVRLLVLCKVLFNPRDTDDGENDGEGNWDCRLSMQRLLQRVPRLNSKKKHLLSCWLLEEIDLFKNFGVAANLDVRFSHLLGDHFKGMLSSAGRSSSVHNTSDLSAWMSSMLRCMCDSPDALLDFVDSLHHTVHDAWMDALGGVQGQHSAHAHKSDTAVDVEPSSLLGMYVRRMIAMYSFGQFECIACVHECLAGYLSHNEFGVASLRDPHSAPRMHIDDYLGNGLADTSSLDYERVPGPKYPSMSVYHAADCIEACTPETVRNHLLRLLVCVSRLELQGTINSLHRYFDYALSGGGPCSLTADGSVGSVVHYAALAHAVVQLRFGHSDTAAMALRETLRIAQQRRDHRCVTYAMSWLSFLSGNLPWSQGTQLLGSQCEPASLDREENDNVSASMYTHNSSDKTNFPEVFRGSVLHLRLCAARVFKNFEATSHVEFDDLRIAVALAFSRAHLQIANERLCGLWEEISNSCVGKCTRFGNLHSNAETANHTIYATRVRFSPAGSLMLYAWAWLRMSLNSAVFTLLRPVQMATSSALCDYRNPPRYNGQHHVGMPHQNVFCAPNNKVLLSTHTAMYRHMVAAKSWSRIGHYGLACLASALIERQQRFDAPSVTLWRVAHPCTFDASSSESDIHKAPDCSLRWMTPPTSVVIVPDHGYKTPKHGLHGARKRLPRHAMSYSAALVGLTQLSHGKVHRCSVYLMNVRIQVIRYELHRFRPSAATY